MTFCGFSKGTYSSSSSKLSKSWAEKGSPVRRVSALEKRLSGAKEKTLSVSQKRQAQYRPLSSGSGS
jgi:hypothetical protein